MATPWMGLIDPPSPFATLEKWERFLEVVRGLPKNGLGVRQTLKEAEKMVAEKRRERQRQRRKASRQLDRHGSKRRQD